MIFCQGNDDAISKINDLTRQAFYAKKENERCNMKINFEGLSRGKTVDNVVAPREIFGLLPRKGGRFLYLRDVQAEVLNQWFRRKDEKDIVLKMNTGSGKTLIGLLILKSSLNDGVMPAVYVVPDSYLVQQVISQANELGVVTTDDATDLGFLSGKKVLVINVYKLVNGKSVFGVGSEGSKIQIGCLVIDDVHACLSTTESQFTLRIDSGIKAYTELLRLFLDDLQRQSDAGVREIQDADPNRIMPVPFWGWISKLDKVTSILHKIREEDGILFVWPLIKECLKQCTCVFGADEVEISPWNLPIDMIPSFVHAKRRIFMSATLSDDSVLVSHYDVDPIAVTKTIVPSSSDDVGDRMILVPEELNPEISPDDFKAFLKHLSAKYNVVVIVPSNPRASYWADVAENILTSTNLQDGIKELHKGHVGLVVFVNKYDGIDLPQDACRILVLDGLPDVRRKFDKVEQAVLAGSDYVMTPMIQRIEQGMGRGIRSNDDYCVVFLKGRTLTRQLYVQKAINKFTPATKEQFELSSKLAEQVRGSTIDKFQDVIAYCLDRSPEWLKASRGILVDLKYKSEGYINPVAVGRRKAFNAARLNNFETPIKEMQALVDQTGDLRLRGWLKQQLANYEYMVDPVKSQLILQSAIQDNRSVLRPLEGITYNRLDPSKLDQAKQLSQYIKGTYSNANSLILEIYSLIEQLVLVPDTANEFEEACKNIAKHLGFLAQRPEQETGKGPDVLWAIGQKNYLVIECKNGATTSEINKHDSDQLSGSMNWFATKYDNTCVAIPLMIHPVEIFNYSASPHSTTRIINVTKLEELRNNLREFFRTLSQLKIDDIKETARLLINYGLTSDLFVCKYTVPFKTKKR